VRFARHDRSAGGSGKLTHRAVRRHTNQLSWILERDRMSDHQLVSEQRLEAEVQQEGEGA